MHRFPRIVTGILILVIVLLFIGFYFYLFLFRAPGNFPQGSIVTVPHGANLKSIADLFEKEHVVRSGTWLTNFVIATGEEERVTEGDYYFPNRENVLSVARRLTTGDLKLVPTKVTIPEGSNIYDIADIIKSKFTTFNSRYFLTLAKDKEGYLFPDTYFLMPSSQPEDVIRILSDNFKAKVKPVQEEIENSGHTVDEIITMASILEGEARQMETRQIVAGILWKRLEENMLLQVDASFRYINGKTSDELTVNDLKIDSPYNTYKYRGLPPTPISNPGIESISAALHPKESSYYFFLTDRNGTMHYAKTLKEHEANQKKYLNPNAKSSL